jgi:uncharacterized membrane protein YjdF
MVTIIMVIEDFLVHRMNPRYTPRMHPHSLLQKFKYIGMFTFFYLLVAIFFSIQTGNTEFLFYIAVVLILGVVVLFVDRRVGLSPVLIWLLSLWGLLHMAGGLVPVPESWPVEGSKAVFYSLWIIPNLLKYDHVVHAYGFGLATWTCWQSLRFALKRSEPTGGILFLCVLGGMGLGGLNEIIEFIATLVIPNTNVGGYVNTGWDLVSNLVGSCIAAVMIRTIRSKQRA